MNVLIKLLLNAVAVFALANILSGVSVDGYMSAIIVALVLSVLNLFVKPLLVVFTLPVTIVTLGLFLLVINGLIILLADKFITGFSVDSIWWAILFSVLLSILQSLLRSFLKKEKK
ncbi:phage holin family protein [uncultured Algibacter sp.]|uniref:phage holin family protein n=1 Tax=uncultured Algibacter sp. TaxID=298659 RepID=UPI003217D83A